MNSYAIGRYREALGEKNHALFHNDRKKPPRTQMCFVAGLARTRSHSTTRMVLLLDPAEKSCGITYSLKLLPLVAPASPSKVLGLDPSDGTLGMKKLSFDYSLSAEFVPVKASEVCPWYPRGLFSGGAGL